MKNLYLIILPFLFTLVSCAGVYKQASHVSSQTYVGMSIQEFKQLAGYRATLEAMDSGFTVFKMVDIDYVTGGIIDEKFFYFNKEGKLFKFDGGEFRQRRYQIEYIHN
jgi:hypothetical protein